MSNSESDSVQKSLRRHRPWSAEEIEAAVKMRARGVMPSDIARTLGRTYSAVASKLNERGGSSMARRHRLAEEWLATDQTAPNAFREFCAWKGIHPSTLHKAIAEIRVEVGPRPEVLPTVQTHRCMACRKVFGPRFRGEWYCCPSCRSAAQEARYA